MGLLCGIEFEYLLLQREGPDAGRIRDFSSLDFETLSAQLHERPGTDDHSLATGDLGVKRGYWYLEGDERFHPDGRFHTMAVKGIEIRTPPRPGIDPALAHLLQTQAQLERRLADIGLGLGMAGFNPVHPGYQFDPPLNAWERDLRRQVRAYDGSLISTMSYGPDINLSWPDWTARQSLAAAQRMAQCAPWIVAFSFSSPFSGGKAWDGWSRRTFERAGLRPLVKLYLPPSQWEAWRAESPLVHPVRLPSEAGRIEFKAFDTIPSTPWLRACCHLLVGIALAEDLRCPVAGDSTGLLRQAARRGFEDEGLRDGAMSVVEQAAGALERRERGLGAALDPLRRLLASRRSPAHAMRERWAQGGPMVVEGGLAPL